MYTYTCTHKYDNARTCTHKYDNVRTHTHKYDNVCTRTQVRQCLVSILGVLHAEVHV